MEEEKQTAEPTVIVVAEPEKDEVPEPTKTEHGVEAPPAIATPGPSHAAACTPSVPVEWGPTPVKVPSRDALIHRRVTQLIQEAQQQEEAMELEAQQQALRLIKQSQQRRAVAAAAATPVVTSVPASPLPPARPARLAQRALAAPPAPPARVRSSLAGPRVVVTDYVEPSWDSTYEDPFGRCEECGSRGCDGGCWRRRRRGRDRDCDFRPRFADNCCPVSCFPSVGCTTVPVVYGAACGLYGGVYGRGRGCGSDYGYGYGYGNGYGCGGYGGYPLPVAVPVATQQPVAAMGTVCGPAGCSLTVQPAVQTCTLGGCVTTPVGPPNLAGCLPSWL